MAGQLGPGVPRARHGTCRTYGLSTTRSCSAWVARWPVTVTNMHYQFEVQRSDRIETSNIFKIEDLYSPNPWVAAEQRLQKSAYLSSLSNSPPEEQARRTVFPDMQVSDQARVPGL